ncbi:MAG: hypothetical protein J0L61_08615 [Planctomycetes bacterium]|nr:hypothetical protein [Planctomycetota bacterium]
MEPLRISPKYTAKDWEKLDKAKPADWPKAVKIVRDRLHGRFLHFADKCLKDDFSGFVVLAIDCLLAETLQQFIDGVTNGHGRSKELSKKFLGGSRFQPSFNTDDIRGAFYSDIRCGLLHQAEAKNKWLIRRKQKALLKLVGDGYLIDVERFHTAIKGSLRDYFADLCNPARTDLRDNLWTKMDHICSVRAARGAMETLDPAAATPTA